MSDESKYGKHYSEDGFWSKIKKYAIDAGLKVVYSALILYYALESPKTSLRDRAVIYGALGYLILPIDALPDIIPGGYIDDLGVLLFAAARVIMSIDATVKQKAKQKLVDFFGNVALDSDEIKDVDDQISGDDDIDPSPVK